MVAKEIQAINVLNTATVFLELANTKVAEENPMNPARAGFNAFHSKRDSLNKILSILHCMFSVTV